jgi:soluble lytic murein transglycosylase-like protein
MNYSDQIAAAAPAYGIDPALALAVAKAESSFNPNAISAAGAIGLFQLLPATAAALGVDPYDPQQNIAGGLTYLSQMLQRYGGDLAAALGAYNWGPTRVSQAIATYGAAWLSHAPAETRAYIARITGMLPATDPQTPTAGPEDPAGAGNTEPWIPGFTIDAAPYLGGAAVIILGLALLD